MRHNARHKVRHNARPKVRPKVRRKVKHKVKHKQASRRFEHAPHIDTSYTAEHDGHFIAKSRPLGGWCTPKSAAVDRRLSVVSEL